MRSLFCFLMFLSFVLCAFGQFGDPVPRDPHEIDGLVHVPGMRLYFSETDLLIPGRGLNLDFTRYYNGNAGYEESPAYLGFRWGHSYQWALGFAFYQNPLTDSSGYWHDVCYVKPPWGGAYRFYKRVNHRYQRLHTDWRPSHGVRGSLTETGSGDSRVFTYTTKHGVSYKLKDTAAGNQKWYVLTEIKDRNGNKLTLHYENNVTGYFKRQRPRLVAVTDTVGRVLKFHYGLRIIHFGTTIPNPRHITKIEFGKGTAQKLTTVYQTIHYDYPSTPKRQNPFTKIRYQLGSGDPRGSEVGIGYEYEIGEYDYDKNVGRGPLAAIVFANGSRQEFTRNQHVPITVIQRDAPQTSDSTGAILHKRIYAKKTTYIDWRYIKNLRVLKLRVSDGSGGRRTRTYDLSPIGPNVTYDNGPVYCRAVDAYRNTVISSQKRGDATEEWDYRIEYKNSTQNPNNLIQGNPTKWKQVDPAKTVLREWTADYDPKYHFPIWQKDPMGHKTEFSYDSKGNLTKVKRVKNTGTQPHKIAHDIVTTHAYDTYGNRIKTTSQLSTTQTQVVETKYDSTYHTYPTEVKTTVTKGGKQHTIKTKSEWDVHRGLKTADIDAGGNRVEYAYWKDRKLKYTKDVKANLYTVPTYDKNGQVTQVVVRQNNWQTGTLIAQKKTEYDGIGRVTKVHSFNNTNWTTPYATTETTYDAFGDVATTKDPRGLTTSYTYDNLGRVTKQTLPDGDWVETRYNALSKVTKSWTSDNGTETSPAVSYIYDTLNRPKTVSYKTGESIAYTYDKNDNLLTLTTKEGSQTYTYTYTHDPLNRVITRNDSLLGYKTFLAYDDAGRRTRQHIRTSTGTTDLYDVTYAYDKANRLISVKDVGAGKTASYDYFDIGALKTTTLPNGITTHRTLDNRHRLDQLQFKKSSSSELASLDYTYDVKSNVTKLVRNLTGAGGSKKTFSFGYDGISRLTRANYGNETVSYTYDKAGNRLTQVSTVDGTTNYTIAKDSNQLTYRSRVPESADFSTMNYAYDKAGKLTKRHEGTDSDVFTYGWGSMLKQVKINRNNTVKQTLSYGYDGGGRRVKVQDSQGTRYFVYDGGMPVLELDAQKKITASYLYGANGVVYRRIHGATKTKDRYEYHHVNGVGSPIVLTDNSKNVVARYEYDVFGAVRNETGSSDNPRKFTGKEWDNDAKLYYYAARYYDPYIGRFNQRDPIGDGVNWYAYGYNNPLRFIDPDGFRALNTHEREVAESFFGDMIDLEQVSIEESGVRYRILTRNNEGNYVTVHDTIYGKNMSDDFLIHELVHVWQYKQGNIEPITALATHVVAEGIEAATGKDKLLYNYTLDDFNDPSRRSFDQYDFEKQAAIMQDAYRYLHLNKRPLHNDEMRRFNWKTDYWTEYYETILEEFKQLHQRPPQSSSNSYMTHN